MTPRSSAPPAAEWPDREARAPSAAGLGRALAVGVVLLELLWIAYVFVHLLPTPAFGLDYQWHVDATRRLITVGTPYWPWQTAGPYTIGNGAILYPPTAFLLFLPFLWLPAPLWWIIPIAITVAAMTRHRPPIWIWPLTVGLFCLEGSLNVYVFGNPSMWIVAAIALGTVWRWAFAFVILKPTFIVLALLGLRHRSWWIAIGLIVAVSLVFGRLWLDWIAVATNSGVSLAYNLPTVPLIVAPLIPWLASNWRRGNHQGPASDGGLAAEPS